MEARYLALFGGCGGRLSETTDPKTVAGSNRGMAKPRLRTIRGKIGGGWKAPFGDPIPSARGRRLVPETAYSNAFLD
jgi:hypothetical protein